MAALTTRLIRCSSDLLEMFGARTEDGRRLTAEWGEPVGHCPDSDEYIYEPVFTEHGESPLKALEAAHAALGSFLWLGNNLHNSDTETFRDLYRAALTDAQTAYEASVAFKESSDAEGVS